MLETFGDFFVPLMKILDKLPNRAEQAGTVLLIFEQTYREELAPYQYSENQSGHIRWEHNVRWSREKLKLLGLLDAPKIGMWRLTEEGHQWLVEHPEATHLSANMPKTGQKKKQPSPIYTPKPRALQQESEDGFYSVLENKLPKLLQPILGSVPFDLAQRSNYLQIRLAGYSGSHYEISLRRSKLEIALHFESSAERSQTRLRAFKPYIEELNRKLNTVVYVGDFQQSRGWTKIQIEKLRHPLVPVSIKEDLDLICGFVTATFPILQQAYANDRKIHHNPKENGKLSDAPLRHNILDQEVEAIRSYLQGRTSTQLSDEKICDWVNFCYTFGMYSEGKDLFSLVSSNDVNPWYYARTKKIAKACETKVQ